MKHWPLILLALAVIVAAILLVEHMQPGDLPKNPSGERTTRQSTWCAVKADDANRLMNGLPVKGMVYGVEEGASVLMQGNGEGAIVLVYVESGGQAGKRCYVPAKMLSPTR